MFCLLPEALTRAVFIFGSLICDWKSAREKSPFDFFGDETMKQYRAVIFDMDGVIVDSEPLHERAFLEVFEEMGCRENHGMDFKAYYGRSDRALWEDFVAKHHPPYPFEELVAWKQNRFIELVRREQPIFPKIPALLAALEPRYALALASGSSHAVIKEVLALGQLQRFFRVVVSVQDVGRNKPAPDIFLLAASRLGVSPSECVVIEDSIVGVQAGRAAGMDVIAITNSVPREQLSEATHVVDSYDEIAALLIPELNGSLEEWSSAKPACQVLNPQRSPRY